MGRNDRDFTAVLQMTNPQNPKALYSPVGGGDISTTPMSRRSTSGSAGQLQLLQGLQGLIEQFVKQVVTTVETATSQRVQTAIVSALGNAGGVFPRRRGRPPKNPFLSGVTLLAPIRPRAKQLCPVPGCNNPAAPVFGMVCADHKDVPKTKIKQYRAARRAAKTKAKSEKN
jgi:hypothetical protein